MIDPTSSAQRPFTAYNVFMSITITVHTTSYYWSVVRAMPL